MPPPPFAVVWAEGLKRPGAGDGEVEEAREDVLDDAPARGWDGAAFVNEPNARRGGDWIGSAWSAGEAMVCRIRAWGGECVDGRVYGYVIVTSVR